MALPPAAAPQKPDPTAATPSPPAGGASPPAPPNNGAPPAGQQQAPAGGKAPAAKPAGGSIYEAIGETPPGEDGSAAWPSDWREQVSEGIDPKQAKMLERFPSVKELAKSWIAQRQLISSGEYKRAAPKGDSPEDVKAWREEQDIPESPDGYDLPTVQGVDMANLDEGTKATLGIIKGSLHEANFSKEKAAVVANTLIKVAAVQAEQQAQVDAQNRDAIEDTLRAEWGAEYRRNIDMNGAFLTKHFGDGMDDLLNARTPTGMRLADSPEFNKFLNTMAREGGGDILFAGDTKGASSIDARLAEIRQVMNSNFDEYRSKGLDKEYRELLEKQEARAAR